MAIYEVTLNGCTTEPLMNYLKALGVLRIVAEQKDSQAKGCWRNGVFFLKSSMDEEALVDFFVNEYKSTPVFSPWNGEGGFLTDSGKNFEIVNDLRNSTESRLSNLALAISSIDKVKILAEFKQARETEKILKKQKEEAKKKNIEFPDADAETLRIASAQVKQIKDNILAEVRNTFPEVIVRWLDACLSIKSEGFTASPLLGSGGCDGRLEFSANFLGNCFAFINADVPKRKKWCLVSLFSAGFAPLVSSAIGQFSPGNIGGPNATYGMEGASLVNPFDFLLMIEGSLLFAGSVSRKFNADEDGKGAFPFTVYASSVGIAMDADTDSKTARGEIWLPMWDRYCGIPELSQILAEGRAEISRKQANTGVQLARAIGSMGVDRGINTFVRYGFLQRSGNAYLATPLEKFETHSVVNIDLIREIDPWLDRFRRAASDSKAPPRFRRVLHAIETSIFAFCQYGGPTHFSRVICSLGQAEKELAAGEKFREAKFIKPLCGLSSQWIAAANDGTPEFEIALALSGIWDPDYHLGAIRSNLEASEIYSKKVSTYSKWADKNKQVVWSGANFVENLVAVLERRMLDAAKMGCQRLPLASQHSASVESISLFLAGHLDDNRISELLWGLVLINHSKKQSALKLKAHYEAPPLPRAYALLKLLFLPYNVNYGANDINIKAESSVLTLLKAGHIDKACFLAMRRLRSSGLVPMPHMRGHSRDGEWQNVLGNINAKRLAAALLIPVSKNNVDHLVGLIARPQTEARIAAW